MRSIEILTISLKISVNKAIKVLIASHIYIESLIEKGKPVCITV
jgi:hypothetical protein